MKFFTDIFVVLSLIFVIPFGGFSQQELNNYLPNGNYDKTIPTPEKYFGNKIGTWHQSPDQVVGYFKELAAVSSRMKWIEYGRTHENKPLIVGVFSSETHHDNIETIKEAHQKMTHPKKANDVDISVLPAILYQGYSIHGNEQSGMHAAIWVAYYLAAAQSSEVEELLENTVILIDPCLNPDGSQRFTTWVNSHKSKTLVSDPASREFSEVWPGGRYNHYWFDLNRDWLLLVHPESRARIKLLREWCPNVVGDYHEMGTNTTYFFQPGVPSRNNPNTPEQNFELTEKIAQFHAAGLDSIGSRYYTKSNFDDFYYGKGSTYPEASGTIGILFEQASSRGHLQESIFGPLSFEATIRNQVVTSLSTQKAVHHLRKDILKYKKNFHKSVKDNWKNNTPKGFIYTDNDKHKLKLFTELLLSHGVEVFQNPSETTFANRKYDKNNSYIVPLDQNQPVLAMTMFEEVKEFQDSLFYDISGWTVAHAYGIDFSPLSNNLSLGKPIKLDDLISPKSPIKEAFAYVIPMGQYSVYEAIYNLQQKGIKLLYNQIDFQYNTTNIPAGSVIIQSAYQNIESSLLNKIVNDVVQECFLDVVAFDDGNGTHFIALGHPGILPLDLPKVAFAVGNSIQPQSAGEVWHHLDMNLKIPATMLDIEKISAKLIEKYNTFVLPSGRYNSWSENEIEILKSWVKDGNTLIVLEQAGDRLQNQNMISLKPKKKDTKPESQLITYGTKSNHQGAQRLGGGIFKLMIDRSHPLFYGVESNDFYTMKRGTQFYEMTSNNTATPAHYAQDFLASGYVPNGWDKTIPKSAAMTVHALGSGRIIYFQDNVLFRGYWKNGEKVFNNALFFGKDIASHSVSEE